MPQFSRSELILNTPVRVELLDAEVLLVDVEDQSFLDPKTGQRSRRSRGRIRITRGDSEIELEFGTGGRLEFDGRLLSISDRVLTVRIP